MTWTSRLLRSGRQRAVEPHFLAQAGSLPPTDKVALWVHWEPTGRVSEADLLLLQHVRQLGFAVVAVGNRDDEGDAALEQDLAAVAEVVLQRRNIGYDFAGFRDGLHWLQSRLRPGSTLLMLNNSMYGPFGNLVPLLKKADAERGDVWAVTGSLEVRPHLQSYFMVVHPAALSTPGFWAHWAGVKPPKDKMQVVYECEVPLALKLHNQGLRARALLPYHELARQALRGLDLVEDYSADAAYTNVIRALRKGVPLNPTHHLWRWMLTSGVPLVKKDLLRTNPPGLPDVDGWRDCVFGDRTLLDAVSLDVAAYRRYKSGAAAK